MREGHLEQRLLALGESAELARGRLDDALVERAGAVIERAGERLGFGLEHTVVALAGATGVGKSRLFNRVAGAELAVVSRRRPTTSATRAAVWGGGADSLLGWLAVDERHQLPPDQLDGLVLLDLPDFDSIEAWHRTEAERVIALADLVLWVVEPQKYADAALHERYLQPLASHAAAMAVVLNQADLLAPPQTGAWRDHARELLAHDGLRDVPLLVVSAQSGEGVDGLRRLLAERVAARDAALARLAGDASAAAAELAAACAGEAAPGLRRQDRARLLAALEDAVGLPDILRAVAEAHRRRGALAAGWPPLRWVRRLRPDPLRRLGLADGRPAELRRGDGQPLDHAQRAQVAIAVRTLADSAADGLGAPWPALVRRAATARYDEVAASLQEAVAGSDLRLAGPHWWRPVGWLQRVLVVVMAVGAAWLAVLAALGLLRIDEVVPLPEVRGVPVPTALLLGGVALGGALAVLVRWANSFGARRRARAASRSLRAAIASVADDLVVAPVRDELDARTRLCAALERARR